MNETTTSILMRQLENKKEHFQSRNQTKMEERKNQEAYLSDLEDKLSDIQKQLNHTSETLLAKTKLLSSKQKESKDLILSLDITLPENIEKIKSLHIEISELEKEMDSLNILKSQLIVDKGKLQLEIKDFTLPPLIVNPYAEIESLLKDKPEVKEEFTKMEKPLAILDKIYDNKDWHIDIDLDFVLDNSFSTPKIGFSQIELSVGSEFLRLLPQEVFTHSEDDICRGCVVDTFYYYTNALNVSHASSIYDLFNEVIPVNDIHLELMRSGENEKHLKSIYLKNPYAESSEENYVKISPSDNEYIERDRNRDTNPFSIFVSFSEFPTSLI